VLVICKRQEFNCMSILLEKNGCTSVAEHRFDKRRRPSSEDIHKVF